MQEIIGGWGERDSSLARVGTRFDRLTPERGLADVVTAIHVICDLDDASVDRRMAIAPAWVRLRHDSSLRARRLSGEQVTAIEDARDVLRVSTQYELRVTTVPPFPGWLSIPDDAGALSAIATRREDLIAHLGDIQRVVTTSE